MSPVTACLWPGTSSSRCSKIFSAVHFFCFFANGYGSTANPYVLSERGDVQDSSRYYLKSPQELIAHPLISYGSHSVNHYVMSSLSTDQQWREIEDNRRFLNQFENIQKSDIFSVPFGGDQDYNNLTRDMAIQSGHTGLLLSRNRLQKSKKNEGHNISLSIERMMSRSTDIQSLVADLSGAAERTRMVHPRV